MIIKIQKEAKGLYSCGMNKISTRFIEVRNEDGEVGILSGDQLNEQLKKYGFEIVDYRPIEQGDL